MGRGVKMAIAAVAAAVVLVLGGWVLYATVINDPADELTAQDLSERLDATTTAAPETAAPGTGAPTTSSTEAAAASVDGDWAVGEGSEVGYRVQETLGGVATEGVGRTTEVTGTLTIAGTQVSGGSFTVQVATITSDDSRRDGQFAGRIMDAATHPEATFVITAPIELGEIPADGVQVTATATGDLTLKGVTRSVTFEVTAQRDGGRIGVLGSIPVVFADFGIANPSFGPVQTEDEGELEVLLVLDRT